MKKSQPTWTHVKDKLAGFDRQGLVTLIQDLYAAHKDNRTFLHTRFGLGEDILEPYKRTIERSISPDPGLTARILNISVATAKQAIADYKKAVGDRAGLGEPSGRDELIARLDQVRIISHKFGYGVGDTMDDILGTSTESGD